MINKVKHGLDPHSQTITEKTDWPPGVFLTEESALQCIGEQFRDTRDRLSVNPVTFTVNAWTIKLWVVTDGIWSKL